MRGSPLPEMDAEQQRDVITNDRQLLEERGFPDGARHFFAPYHSIDGDTVAVLREAHPTGFLYGGSSAGVPATAPYTLPTINGNDYDSSRAVVLRANLHDQIVVLGFDEIGGDGMPVGDFEVQLDRIEDNDYAVGWTASRPRGSSTSTSEEPLYGRRSETAEVRAPPVRGATTRGAQSSQPEFASIDRARTD